MYIKYMNILLRGKHRYRNE